VTGLLAAGLALGQGLAPSGVGQIAPPAILPVSVPYRLSDGLIVVKAGISRERPVEAVLALAAPLCVAAPDLAVQEQMKTQAFIQLPTLYGVVQASAVNPQSLAIGPHRLANVPFAVFDMHGHLSKRPSGGQPPLWIGASALAATSVTIDPERSVVVFRAASDGLPRGGWIVPIEVQDGRIFVEARANGGRPFRALLDTACSGSLLPAPVAHSLALAPEGTAKVLLPDGNEGTVSAATVRELAFGGAKTKDVRVLFVSQGAGLEHAVIGTDALLRFRVTISYAARRIALERIKPPSRGPARPSVG